MNAPKAEFDGFAGDYDAALNQGISLSGEDKNYFAAGRVNWLAARLALLEGPFQTAMDFGCGTGSATPFLFEALKLKSLVGVDVSEDSLVVARQQWAGTPSTFIRSQAYAPTANLDFAFCNGVFHHIPLPQRAGAAKFVFDSLRPGGVFAFWENNPWNPGTRMVMSRIPFDRDAITLTPPEARGLLKAAGFEILRTDFLFWFPKPLAFLRPLEPMLAGIPLGAQYQVLCRR